MLPGMPLYSDIIKITMVSGHRATRKRRCHPGKLGHSASPVGSFASSSLFPFPSPCPKELLLGYNERLLY